MQSRSLVTTTSLMFNACEATEALVAQPEKVVTHPTCPGCILAAVQYHQTLSMPLTHVTTTSPIPNGDVPAPTITATEPQPDYYHQCPFKMPC